MPQLERDKCLKLQDMAVVPKGTEGRQPSAPKDASRSEIYHDFTWLDLVELGLVC